MKPFEQVVTEHGATVLRVCRAVVGPVDAEDAWSETFLAAMRAYPGLPPDANVQAWLVTIARRKGIDMLRAAARRPVPVAEPPEPSGRGHAHAPDDGDLLEVLATLPEKQRAAVVYHHLGGLPYREVAQVLGGTPEAARRAASDGVAALRRQLSVPTSGGRR